MTLARLEPGKGSSFLMLWIFSHIEFTMYVRSKAIFYINRARRYGARLEYDCGDGRGFDLTSADPKPQTLTLMCTDQDQWVFEDDVLEGVVLDPDETDNSTLPVCICKFEQALKYYYSTWNVSSIIFISGTHCTAPPEPPTGMLYEPFNFQTGQLFGQQEIVESVKISSGVSTYSQL